MKYILYVIVYIALSTNLFASSFTYNKGSWRVEKNPRLLADVNGDGLADIVGFGNDTVVTALGKRDGTFAPFFASYKNGLTYNKGSWRVEKNPRLLADVNGDGRADIVGFGNDTVVTALGKRDGTFTPFFASYKNGLTYNKGSWRVEKNPRLLADVNGDGRADIVGFGNDTVVTALGKRDGTFAPFFASYKNGLTYNKGSWRVEKNPRLLADVNGDGRADIVGFGNDTVVTALGKRDGTFAPFFASYKNGLTYNKGSWRVEKNPRLLADVNGDGRADIVGFGNDTVVTALGKRDGTFAPAITSFARMTYNKGSWRVEKNPRLLADVNGDGRVDIIGFANDIVVTVLGSPVGKFTNAKRADFELSGPIIKNGKVSQVPIRKITSAWPESSQTKSSIKHRITQYAFLKKQGDKITVKSQIRNKDRYSGRTMCSEVRLYDRKFDLFGSSNIRAGIKRRGNHTRWRTKVHSITIPSYMDQNGASVWVIDTYCPKDPWSRGLRTLGKFVKKPVRETLRSGGQIVRVVGKAKDQVLAEASSGMRKLGGKDLQKVFDDVVSVTRIVDDKLIGSAISGVQSFVNDGNIQHLDPVVAIGISQIESARAELRRKATPVPKAVLDILPVHIRSRVSSARYIEKHRVPELSYAHIGLMDVRAIVMDDVIVFHDGQVPSIETVDGKYLWAHELFHVYQYKSAGVRAFTQRYLANELGFKSNSRNSGHSNNPIEEEADIFACLVEPKSEPTYIDRCP